jgi:glycosyltransferase involved in cell wall biosynthesis
MPTGRPLRVVYLDHCARISGGEIALVRLLEGLRGRVQAHVLLGEHGPIEEQLEAAGARVEVLPMAEGVRDTRRDEVGARAVSASSVRDLGTYGVRLTRRLRQLRPDLVHTNSLKAALYGGVCGRAACTPVLWHIRDRIDVDYLPRPAVRMVRGLSRVLPREVVVNSRMTAGTLPRRSTVVYDVVPDELAEAGAARPSRTSRDDGDVVIGMLGRLAHWKGQHVFLDAFARAAARADGRRLRARLIGSAMFGEDDYERRLRDQVARLGIADLVEFRGFREDVAAELAELDVLVHASVSPEPFGQVVVEGMAARLPVVASAAGGPSEVVTDGVDGLLVPPGDVEGFADAMVALATDPPLRERLAEAGLRTSAAYRPDAVARQMLAIYERVV